ncbi:MAG: winged helix-turn-helix domain-containing protein [Pseudomonadota bacterium]
MTEQPQVDLAHTPPFRLGAVEVRPATRELVGPSGRERLEPRVMQVLVALAKAGGEIVSRDDLIESCWEGRIVGQDAVNRVISKIRALAETMGAGSFGVETITKVGYRLIVADQAAPTDQTATPPAPAAPARPVVDRRLLIGGAAAAAAAGGGAWWFYKGRKPDVPEAALVLHAKGMEASRIGTVEATAQATGFLQQAVALAPDYAEGWGALALAYQNGLYFLADDAARQAAQRAKAAARRAIELDPRNANAHAALALDIPSYGNWLAAEQALRKVLELDPAQFEACSALSRILASVGRSRDAISALEPIARQTKLEPTIQFRLAYLLWVVGRLDESDRIIDEAMDLWPRSYQIWFTRFWLFVHTGRSTEAIAMCRDQVRRPPGIPDWNFKLIEDTAHALLTRAPADVENAVQANLEAARKGAGFAENAVEVISELGRVDQAYAVIDAYYFGRGFTIGSVRYSTQQGSYTPPSRLQTAFLFTPPSAALRAEPRFGELAQALGLTDYWRKSGKTADVLAGREQG